ncbi:methyltransferase domain-containing protein [Sphingomonas paeninsulae]|jgi:ubiquinone/menaquinone biosynthesis C-methylase UbiE|uniref:Methyltransferase domain-containing protein n=1 Tax=Sphingomonas paeninsulae TaxID=2319844 RepID=A0A494TD36_SPHPE|nr:metalloregulator ArsR/SmtB family transcription factor [Sphingomonas paeninsulae]AYJ87409.1 methyltransferase domain-containing protein [Sphingomonas paeninsulae]
MIEVIDIFRALADPTRLRIIALLRTMELSVGEMAQVLEQSQPRVSRHVRILCDAGLATRRREGSWVFLAPAPSALAVPLFGLLDVATAGQGDHQQRADVARLAAVRADRTAAASRYFAQHADHWDAIRSLHVAESAVEARMHAVLGDNIGRLVDIGTGTGRMIELFGSKAAHTVGIDRSPEMLRLARSKLSESGAEKWELRQGDLTALPLEDSSADTVILHQVLHYIPTPEAALAEVGRLLAPGGRLLIVDFASHDREELRVQDAHARLGFSDRQMGLWFVAAGLSLDRTETLDGGELTVKLWLATRPALMKAIAA